MRSEGARGLRLRVVAQVAVFAMLLGVAAVGESAVPAWGGVQATQPQGTLGDPTLVSDEPGVVVVSWDLPSPIPTDYRIDWAKSGESYTSWRVDEGHVYPAGAETSVSVTGLDAGAEYKVRMRARYHKLDYAASPWSGPWTGDVTIVVAAEQAADQTESEENSEPEVSAEQQGTEQQQGTERDESSENEENTEPLPPGSIPALAASSPVPGSLEVVWQAPESAPSDYRVSWHKADEPAPSWRDTDRNAYTSFESITITGLEPDADYTVRVRARYKAPVHRPSWSGPFVNVTARVSFGVPGTPTGLGAAEVTHQQATLSWEAPANSKVTGYRITRSTGGAAPQTIVDDTGTTATVYTDTGLDPETGYTYRVAALNPAGVGAESDPAEATTAAAVAKASSVSGKSDSNNGKSDSKSGRSDSSDTTDATLSAFKLMIGTEEHELDGFSAGATSYSGSVVLEDSVAVVTVIAVSSNDSATVTVSPDDDDTNTTGHQINLVEGTRHQITVTVVSADTEHRNSYALEVVRASNEAFGWNALKDLNTPGNNGHNWLEGIWSDRSTIWIANHSIDEINAYDLNTGVRQPSLDLPTIQDPGYVYHSGLWSDGERMWVSDDRRNIIRVYDLDTRERLTDLEFSSETMQSGMTRTNPVCSLGDTCIDSWSFRGIWSDGEIMWVAYYSGLVRKLYAFNLQTHERIVDRDITLAKTNRASHFGGGEHMASPANLWSDGVTIWITDISADRIFAYDLATGARKESLEFRHTALENWPYPHSSSGRYPYHMSGVWSDGRTMWLGDIGLAKLFAYNMPTSAALYSLDLFDIDAMHTSGRYDVDFFFSTGRSTYNHEVPNSVSTLTVDAEAAFSSSTVAIVHQHAAEEEGADPVEISTDAGTTEDGYQINLVEGTNTVTITVTNGELTRVYTVTLERQSSGG